MKLTQLVAKLAVGVVDDVYIAIKNSEIVKDIKEVSKDEIKK